MTSQEMTRQKMLSEAKKFFLDAAEYNDYELLGFWRLANDIYKEGKLSRPASLYVSVLEELIKRQSERQYTILCFKYGECYTLREIGLRLSLSGARIQQLKDESLRLLRRSLSKKSGKSIKVLKLNDKLADALDKKYISWISRLVRCSETDLLAITGVDESDVEEIKEKLAMFGAELSKRTYWVMSLGLSGKATNILEANRIIHVDKLLAMTEKQLMNIKGLDDETREEIVNKRAELLQ